MTRPMTQQVAIRMSAETRIKLEQMARRENRRVTEMGRILIEQGLKKSK